MKNAIDQVLLNLAKPLIASSMGKEQYNSCAHYSKKDYQQYINGNMHDDECNKFEAHCMSCSNCLIGLYFENDLMENRLIFKKTMSLIDQVNKTASSNLFDIIIRSAHGIIEVIKTNGEILQMPQPVPVRGDNIVPKVKKQISIMYKIPPVSIQSSFQYASEEGNLLLTLSFYNDESDEFMTDVKIHLSGEGFNKESRTDKHGKVIFKIKSAGQYRVKMEIDYTTSVIDLKISE